MGNVIVRPKVVTKREVSKTLLFSKGIIVRVDSIKDVPVWSQNKMPTIKIIKNISNID